MLIPGEISLVLQGMLPWIQTVVIFLFTGLVSSTVTTVTLGKVLKIVASKVQHAQNRRFQIAIFAQNRYFFTAKSREPDLHHTRENMNP
jgi:cell division protein FtsL